MKRLMRKKDLYCVEYTKLWCEIASCKNFKMKILLKFKFFVFFFAIILDNKRYKV